MEDYAKLQVKEIKRFSRLIHKDENEGTMEWIKRGLAKRFALKYREQFGLIAEAI